MNGPLLALCCAALLAAGSALALELRVVISRAAVNPQPVAGQATASRSTLLADFNLALAREVCRRLRARCEYSYAPFAEIIPGIESKRFELGFGNHLRTAAREAQVAFSNPIWRSSSRLLAFPDTALRSPAWPANPQASSLSRRCARFAWRLSAVPSSTLICSVSRRRRTLS
ncbi:MAG: transporter substrate-binding domain-containing protein [Candidatus Accumulibacter meliphilus]|uniref:substrate-binding periplasmic protein n=1 Tax=Candidatus Accumulibacter meliphilus TaxID=2211374 RepID=UPI002FC39B99